MYNMSLVLKEYIVIQIFLILTNTHINIKESVSK